MRSENIDFPIEREFSRVKIWLICLCASLANACKHYMLIFHVGLPKMCFNKLIFMKSRTIFVSFDVFLLSSHADHTHTWFAFFSDF